MAVIPVHQPKYKRNRSSEDVDLVEVTVVSSSAPFLHYPCDGDGWYIEEIDLYLPAIFQTNAKLNVSFVDKSVYQ